MYNINRAITKSCIVLINFTWKPNWEKPQNDFLILYKFYIQFKTNTNWREDTTPWFYHLYWMGAPISWFIGTNLKEAPTYSFHFRDDPYCCIRIHILVPFSLCLVKSGLQSFNSGLIIFHIGAPSSILGLTLSYRGLLELFFNLMKICFSLLDLSLCLTLDINDHLTQQSLW